MPIHHAGLSTSSSPSPSDTAIRITVEINVQVTSDDQEQTSSFYQMEPLVTLTTETPLPITFTPALPEYTQRPSSASRRRDSLPAYTEAALRAIAQDAVLGFHAGVMSVFPEPPPGFRVLDMDAAARLANIVTNEVISFGQRLIAAESLRAHTDAVPDGAGCYVPVGLWMHSLGPLRSVDRPLFFFLRESLHSHTPHHILVRWDMLRCSMRGAGETIATLVRRAEQDLRKKWPPLVLRFYFLMHDHNEALKQSAPSLLPYLGSLQLKLSALTTALRIQYYLFRMTRASPMGGLKVYKSQLLETGITSHIKTLYGLVAQEFARMQDPDFGHFQSIERALVGEAVTVDSISEPLQGNENTFCTICQDSHPLSESVRPLNCHCIFGRSCLEPVLNRDLPFSNACPNCRTQLHEALQWRPILSRDERDFRAGLLWALRSNMLSLKQEIRSDPEPYSNRQRTVDWFRRLAYGGLRTNGQT